MKTLSRLIQFSVLFSLLLAACAAPVTASASTTTNVTVTFSGGYETDPRDGGRPVVLIASVLGVTPTVFRQAFSLVKPAAAGQEPDPTQVTLNKAALLSILSQYGVTNESLDTVSNYYRYNGSAGETWPRRPATATAVVTNGAVTGFIITDAGAGYTSTPTVTISGVGGVTATATVSYSKNFNTNGSITALTLATSNSGMPVVQAANTQDVNAQSAPQAPTVMPPTAAQPSSSSANCPTNNFIDVSTYKPKAGATAPSLKVTCANGVMLIETNGIPNFDVVGPTPTAQNYRWSLTLNPQKANRTTDLSLGPVAVAVNGVPIYGPFESPQDSYGDPVLEGLLRTCNGHAIPFHFHARPDCLFKTVVNQTALVIGYAFDGFPIMAPYTCIDAACTQIKKVTSSWQVISSNSRNVWEHYQYVAGSGDLDKCNGMTGVDGQYRYYATDAFPYTIACYSGTSTASGPGSGGQQPGGQQPGGGQQPPPTRPGGNPPPPPARP